MRRWLEQCLQSFKEDTDELFGVLLLPDSDWRPVVVFDREAKLLRVVGVPLRELEEAEEFLKLDEETIVDFVPFVLLDVLR